MGDEVAERAFQFQGFGGDGGVIGERLRAECEMLKFGSLKPGGGQPKPARSTRSYSPSGPAIA